MSDFNVNPDNQFIPVEESIFDIKLVLSKFINFWYLFVIGVVICLSIAIIVANLISPLWNITSKILIRENSSSAGSGGDHGELSAIFIPRTNPQNEIDI